ncbi:hypothetical protein fugu_006389 [Takifugu bimaculatus]|uniref:S1 motif domain-containing protein n=1 Tax=Takifugu bimaculatus TaxID=433685 RepID=A0A4Z2B9A6_9TELE|nr:hypothetical protein fugu_006389 [Takifugu bimaculatus]
MDRELLKHCLVFHGESLLSKVKCEQKENPDFQAVISDLSKASYERRDDGKSNPLVEQFVARKADILFCPSWRTATHREEEDEEEDAAAEPYAIMPPLEIFMEVSYEERRAMLYRDLERGDVVIGRINNIREYGFFLTLLCTAVGLKRDIEDLELSALCHIREIPSTGSHDDPLSYYQTGDIIRAAVKDIDRYQEKITVSLQKASLSPIMQHIKLGVVASDELPKHYSLSLRAATDTSQTYESILRGCHGYHNPSVVDYLLEKVGISDTHPPSVMRGLQSKFFKEEDFASVIRKKQSASWALKCVRSGVDHFKHGRHVEAMNEYNKALDIDTNNVEALVARGALYANKGSIMKAITDFELALDNCPDHRNAKKYLCQTLVERGRQLEEQEKLVTAEGLYRRALDLDDASAEAQEALRKITETIQKSIRLREEALQKDQVTVKSGQTSADKLRKILKEEKRLKRKQKRSASSSPSSSPSSRSSSSSSSSSSSRRRSKKKKKKKHKSEQGSRRHRRVSSRESRRSEEERGRKDSKEEEEEEWYPAPSNTSASFLNRKGGPGLEEEVEERRSSQLYALSADYDRSDSLCKGRKRGDKEQDKMKSSRNSPERAERTNRGRDESRRDSRRSSIEEENRRRTSCSSTEAENSQKVNVNQVEVRRPDRRSSCEGGGYRNRGWQEHPDNGQMEKEGREERAERESSRSGGGSSSRSQGSGGSLTSAGRPRKDLPSNLLDIFSQIAQFEKEKGIKPK